MCMDYRDDPELSRDANAILRQMHCNETLSRLGHHVVYDETRGWNVPGMMAPAPSTENISRSEIELAKARLKGIRHEF